jgi:hypothetical protein
VFDNNVPFAIEIIARVVGSLMFEGKVIYNQPDEVN